MAVATRHERSESEDDRIESHFLQPRNGALAKDPQHPDCDGRQSEPHHTAEAGKNQAFNEHLTHEPPATRAEGETNGELVHASRRARQHEIGHIDACNKEHESDGDEEKMQRATCNRHEILLQRNGDDGAQARGRPAFFHRPAQARELLRACSRLIPLLKRPTALRELFSDSVSDARLYGIHASTSPVIGSSNPSGAMPTTSYGSPLN